MYYAMIDRTHMLRTALSRRLSPFSSSYARNTSKNCKYFKINRILHNIMRHDCSSEGGSFSLTQIISLPQSLEQLHDNYKVVGRPEVHVQIQ